MNVKKIFVFLLAAIVVSAVGIMRDFELFIPIGILMVSLIGVVIAVLVGLFTRKFKTARRFGLLILISLLATIVDMTMCEKQVESTRQTANTVITALERYRTAHGSLPASLDQLVPEQLPHVPKTRNGSLMYQAAPPDFTLGFPTYLFFVQTYDSKTKQWSRRD